MLAQSQSKLSVGNVQRAERKALDESRLYSVYNLLVLFATWCQRVYLALFNRLSWSI